MKKFFYSFLLLAVAIMTATTLVSCGSDSDDDKAPAASDETHLFFQYWVTDDVLEIADYTVTGLPSFTLNTPKVMDDGTAGKISNMVHLQGKAADEAHFSITYKLKSNWKEIIANKASLTIMAAYLYEKSTNSKGGFGSMEMLPGSKVKTEGLDEEKLTIFLKGLNVSK